jgi:hypothetical protein
MALCPTTGRRVTSDSSVGERHRSAAAWIEVVAQPGRRSFAPLTYGAVEPAVLRRLPACQHEA